MEKITLEEYIKQIDEQIAGVKAKIDDLVLRRENLDQKIDAQKDEPSGFFSKLLKAHRVKRTQRRADSLSKKRIELDIQLHKLYENRDEVVKRYHYVEPKKDDEPMDE